MAFPDILLDESSIAAFDDDRTKEKCGTDGIQSSEHTRNGVTTKENTKKN